MSVTSELKTISSVSDLGDCQDLLRSIPEIRDEFDIVSKIGEGVCEREREIRDVITGSLE